MKNNLGELQIFSVTNEDAQAKKRIDVEYYQPFFEHVVAKVAGSKFGLEKLADVTLLISNGRTPSKDMYDEENDQDGSVPIIKAGTASGRFVNLSKLEYAKADFSNGKKVQKGDVFILSAAHQASYVGKNVSILDVEPEQDTYFVGELICVRANPEKVLPEYLFGFLSSKVGYLLLNREKRGQTSHIYPEDVKNILLPVPSLKDQKSIVAVLSKAYEEKRKKEQEIKMILASIDSFVLDELGIEFDKREGGGKITFHVWSDEMEGIFSPLFFISKPLNHKDFVELKELALVNPLRKKPAFKADELVPYVGLPETDNQKIQEIWMRPYSEVKGRNVIKRGDILFARIEPSVFNKKYIFVDDLEGHEFAFTSTEFYIVEPKKGVNPLFLFYMFFIQPVYDQVIGKTTGSTGRRRLDRGVFEKIFLPCPSERKQQNIADNVKMLYEKANRLREEAENSVIEAERQVEQMILA